MKTCPFCNLYKCDHCRCQGYPGCNHEAGRLCSNGRYARHYFCNQCARLMRDFNNKKDAFLGSKNVSPTKTRKRNSDGVINPSSSIQPQGITPFNSQQYINPNSFIQTFNPINLNPTIPPNVSNTRIWVNNDADLFYFNNDVLKGFESYLNKSDKQPATTSLKIETDISSISTLPTAVNNKNEEPVKNNIINTSIEKEKENTKEKEEKSGFLDELANLALSINNNNNSNSNNDKNTIDLNILNQFSYSFINLQSNTNKSTTTQLSSTNPLNINPIDNNNNQSQQHTPVNSVENNNSNISTVQTVNLISDIVYEASKLNSISIIQIGEYERNDILYLNILHNPNPIAVVAYNKDYDLLSYLRAYITSKLFPKSNYSFVFYTSSGLSILEENESDFYISSLIVENQYFNYITNTNINISSICFGINYKYRVCKRYNNNNENNDDKKNTESPNKKQKCDSNNNVCNEDIKQTSLPPQLQFQQQQCININSFTPSLTESDNIPFTSSSSLPLPPLLEQQQQQQTAENNNNLQSKQLSSNDISSFTPTPNSPFKNIVSRPTPLSFSLNQKPNISIPTQTPSINTSLFSLGINNQVLPLINTQQQQQQQQTALSLTNTILQSNINTSSISTPSIPITQTQQLQIPPVTTATTNRLQEQDLLNLIQQSDDKLKLDLSSDVINYYNGNLEDNLGSLLYHSFYYNDISSFKKLIIMGANLEYKVNDFNIAYYSVYLGKWDFFSLLLSLFYDNNLVFSGKPNFLLNEKVIEQINGLSSNESMKILYKQVIERFVYIKRIDNVEEKNLSLAEFRKELMKKYDKKLQLNHFSFVLNGIFITTNQENDFHCKDILSEKGYLVYINPLIRKHDKSTKHYCTVDNNFIINLQNNWRYAELNQCG